MASSVSRLAFATAIPIAMMGAKQSALQAPLDVRTFLSTTFGVSREDFAAIDRGEPVARILVTTLDRDVAVFGIVTVNTRRDIVASLVSTYPASLRIPGRTGFGILSTPASPDDLASLVLSSRDADALRGCRPGSCAFKLGGSDMTTVRATLGRSSDSAQASGFMRRRLATIANAYRLRGNEAMPVYDDNGGRSVNGAQVFGALLSQTPSLFVFAPGLRDYLRSYPRVNLPGATDILYWARDEASGLQPTSTLDERIAFSPVSVPGATIVATKQIAADHYLEGGLEILAIIDRPVPSGAGVYVMFVRRFRFDQMPKALFVSLRGRVTAKLRDRAVADLLRFRNR